MMPNPSAVVYAPLMLVSVSLLALAIFVLRARPQSSIHRLFAAFTVLTAIWTLSLAQLRVGYQLSFWAKISFACGPLVSLTILFFVYRYPNREHSAPRILLAFLAVIGVVLVVLSLTTRLIIDEVSVVGTVLSRKTGPLYPVFAIHIVASWLTALCTLVFKWRHARGLDRLQVQYFGIAICASLSGAVITNLLLPMFTGLSTYSGIGPYFGFGFVLLAGHGIIRYRLMDLRLVIHRGLTFTIATVLSLVPVAALLAIVGPRVALHLNALEITTGIVAILLVALIVPVTRDAASRLLDRYVYRRHANYQRTVRGASSALTRILHLKTLVTFMQETITGAVECEGVALYLRRGTTLRRGAEESPQEIGAVEAPGELSSELLDRLTTSRDVIVTDELTRDRAQSENYTLYSELTRLNWALVLPAMSEDSVIGAIVLGPKRSGDPYYPQDLDLLMTLANQAGIAIKNAQLYAQVVLANEHLENILSTVTSGVVAVDADGAVTMFNAAAERLTGLAHGRVHAQPLDALPAQLSVALRETLEHGAAQTHPDIDLSDGTITRPIMCMTSPLRDPDGSLLGAVAVFSDLTPVRALEIERRRVERLAYLETFASGIAHEVKNPLVSIKTFAQLLPRRRAEEAFVGEFSRIVTREIARMERLIERLQTLSRPGERPSRILDIRQPLVDALEFMQPSFEDKDVRVEAALGETEAPVIGNAGELEQLFLNLLMNAKEATPRQGRIVVAVLAGDGRVAVSVADTGAGIPADALGRVFDPFFTTKERGSGLGLAICAGIADTHGARLSADNLPAGGARFTVEFPRANEVTAPVDS